MSNTTELSSIYVTFVDRDLTIIEIVLLGFVFLVMMILTLVYVVCVEHSDPVRHTVEVNEVSSKSKSQFINVELPPPDFPTVPQMV